MKLPDLGVPCRLPIQWIRSLGSHRDILIVLNQSEIDHEWNYL